MKLLRPSSLALALVLSFGLGASAQDRDPRAIPGLAPSPETSDRSPGERNPTPPAQITRTPEGETSSRTPGLSGEQSSRAGEDRSRAASIDTVRRSLEQAGFRNVQVVETTYLVHATTMTGDSVVMTINSPNRMMGPLGAGSSGAATGVSSGASGAGPR